MKSERTRRAELLAAADGQVVMELADRCLADADPPDLIAGPDTGMVMMTVREPVETIRFHLGEVLVTRAEVVHRGSRGWSMRMGEDKAATLAAAICDAEAEAGGPQRSEVAALCQLTAERLDAERSEEWAELAPTIVHFEEMD